MAPISHGSGLSLLTTLCRGGCTVTQNLPDLSKWCRNIEAEKITGSLLLPTMIYRLLDMKEATDNDLSSLETIGYGGSPISPTKLDQVLARFGNIFVQGYGSTECLQVVTSLSKTDHLTAKEGGHLASAGRVTPGIELMIVDEAGCEVSAGQTGEIWIRCRGVIPGYHKNPEGTASEFTNGFWKSGDLGYLDERGYLYIVDRKKDMIITGGFNVYAIEVEAAVNAHPAVANSAVVGVPNDTWGEAIHAEVVLRANAQLNDEELIAHVKNRIGRFKAPKSVKFVQELPLSAVGKVLRRQVRDKYWKDQVRRVG
jgi:acyl-CoA synthetase (AMP-forming)/AMP-acid ligase II